MSFTDTEKVTIGEQDMNSDISREANKRLLRNSKGTKQITSIQEISGKAVKMQDWGSEREKQNSFVMV